MKYLMILTSLAFSFMAYAANQNPIAIYDFSFLHDRSVVVVHTELSDRNVLTYDVRKPNDWTQPSDIFESPVIYTGKIQTQNLLIDNYISRRIHSLYESEIITKTNLPTCRSRIRLHPLLTIDKLILSPISYKIGGRVQKESAVYLSNQGCWNSKKTRPKTDVDFEKALAIRDLIRVIVEEDYKRSL